MLVRIYPRQQLPGTDQLFTQVCIRFQSILFAFTVDRGLSVRLPRRVGVDFPFHIGVEALWPRAIRAHAR
jgi:hypothetical protein